MRAVAGSADRQADALVTAADRAMRSRVRRALTEALLRVEAGQDLLVAMGEAFEEWRPDSDGTEAGLWARRHLEPLPRITGGLPAQAWLRRALVALGAPKTERAGKALAARWMAEALRQPTT